MRSILLLLIVGLITIFVIVRSAPPPAWSECSNGYVALTYDDGPNINTTAAMLAALDKEDMRVTFFNVGILMREQPELTKSETYAGHAVANHTWYHRSLTDPALTDEEMDFELGATIGAITELDISAPTLFRPPYGNLDNNANWKIQSWGMTPVLWSIDTHDYNDPSAQTIAKRALTSKSGGIVLMHDSGHKNTIAAISIIAEGLKKQNRCPGRIVKSSTPQHAPWPGASNIYWAIAAKW